MLRTIEIYCKAAFVYYFGRKKSHVRRPARTLDPVKPFLQSMPSPQWFAMEVLCASKLTIRATLRSARLDATQLPPSACHRSASAGLLRRATIRAAEAVGAGLATELSGVAVGAQDAAERTRHSEPAWVVVEGAEKKHIGQSRSLC